MKKSHNNQDSQESILRSAQDNPQSIHEIQHEREAATSALPINCKKCEYFYITWQEKHPYGCKMFQMKTRHLPSYHVKRESGMDCLYYHPNAKHLTSAPTSAETTTTDSPSRFILHDDKNAPKESFAKSNNLDKEKSKKTFLTASDKPLINKIG